VLRGTTTEILNKGPGWYEESALPGQGNTAIAGHRTMHGAWFRHLDSLNTGDEIKLTFDGWVYNYTVEKVFPISNNDWSVINPTAYPALTLTTCHPVGSAAQRLVVRAALVSWIKK
jgi:sortase A